MNKNKIIILLFATTFAISLSGQNSTDSLSLSTVLQQVINNYPSLKKAEKELHAAQAKEMLTKTAFLPDINFAASANYIGPVNALSMPGLGSFDLYPHYNYSAAVTINQTVFDFGKTNRGVTIDKDNIEIIKLSTEQIKQKLSLSVITGFYSIAYLQEAINIRKEQLNNLQHHLNFIKKKEETGSATSYDILSTNVRISIIENQIVDLETALQVHSTQLNNLIGNDTSIKIVVKNQSMSITEISTIHNLTEKAYFNRFEVKIAQQREQLAKSKINYIDNQNNPSINAMASGGFKNGYFNSKFEDVGKLNYIVGLGIKLPIFDANRNKYLKIQANAELDANKQETELTKRAINNEVVECRANVLAALKKVTQSELQVKQASRAYDMANTNYQAGTITNLDLLDSYTLLADSKLYLFKSKNDYIISTLRLKLATGENLF